MYIFKSSEDIRFVLISSNSSFFIYVYSISIFPSFYLQLLTSNSRYNLAFFTKCTDIFRHSLDRLHLRSVQLYRLGTKGPFPEVKAAGARGWPLTSIYSSG